MVDSSEVDSRAKKQNLLIQIIKSALFLNLFQSQFGNIEYRKLPQTKKRVLVADYLEVKVDEANLLLFDEVGDLLKTSG